MLLLKAFFLKYVKSWTYWKAIWHLVQLFQQNALPLVEKQAFSSSEEDDNGPKRKRARKSKVMTTKDILFPYFNYSEEGTFVWEAHFFQFRRGWRFWIEDNSQEQSDNDERYLLASETSIRISIATGRGKTFKASNPNWPRSMENLFYTWLIAHRVESFF